MPSGPKRRKAAKKKQAKQSNNSNSSSTTHSHHGESDGGELSSSAAQDQHNHQAPFTEKNEADLYRNKSITLESSEKAEKEEGNTEIDKGSKLNKSHNSSSSSISSSVDDESHVFEKKSVELESTPVAESVHSIESKIVHKVKDSGVEVSAVVDPIKPADSVLEAESHGKDGTQIEKLVPKSAFSEQMLVVNGSASDVKCSTSSEVVEFVVVEDGALELPSLEENASLEARDDVEVAVSSHPMDAVSGLNGADCANEPETSQYSDKQPLIASAPRAVQTTSWKGCCGILELFSSSDR